MMCQATTQDACFDHIEQVVPECSAVLTGYQAIGIHVDHRDIARDLVPWPVRAPSACQMNCRGEQRRLVASWSWLLAASLAGRV